MTLRDQLLELQEPKYMKFTAALMPGVENVLGIRLPVLRKIARQIAAGDWRTYLAEAEDFYFEERMLQGLVIGCARCTPAEKLEHVARFVPKINNWAVCDCFCWRLKAAERQPMWEFIQPYFRSEAEYDVRFAVVTGLGNFVDGEHLENERRHLPRSILRRTGTSVSFDQEHEKPVTAIRQEYGRQPPGRLAFMHTYFTAESEHPGNQNVKK